MSTTKIIRISVHIFLLSTLFPLHLFTASAQAPSPSDIIETAIRHQNLGLAYLEESQPSKAISEFEALVDIISDEPIGYGNLAVAYLRRQKKRRSRSLGKTGA
jgi:Tfp pilus assembly protein PilF